MSQRTPKDDKEPSAAEMLAAVTKDLEESGLSFSEYFGLPEPPDDGRPKLTALEWANAPELIASRERAIEIAEGALAQLDKQADDIHRSWEEVIRLEFEARRKKRQEDAARGGEASSTLRAAIYEAAKQEYWSRWRKDESVTAESIFYAFPEDEEETAVEVDGQTHYVFRQGDRLCQLRDQDGQTESIAIGTLKNYLTKIRREHRGPLGCSRFHRLGSGLPAPGQYT